ncbi:hypothetical protein L6164_020782 [Bauhinia variegata]|uniref:Uncharacterized protein n=1 Tax=Bauhinia variegata TaxID=167791 RepID=A0ACB9MWY0_BAUVA|nr:hypothetical protein L6164_020782 [Bauhinia variegata]
MMALYRNNGELFTERRGIIDGILKAVGKGDHGSRVVHRGRRFGRVTIHRLSQWFLLIVASFSIYMLVFGLKVFFQGAVTPKMETKNSILLGLQEDFSGSEVGRPPKSKHRKQHFPCEVGVLESVDDFVEPKNYMNFTQFSLGYIDQEEKANILSKPRFGGYQSLKEREISFYARNQTLHCGFAKGPAGSSSTGFDLNDRDKAYMNNCKIVVSSCIFGSFDFLRRPTSRLMSQYSKDNVCFVMFVDDETLSKLSSEGNSPDDRGYIGLWKIVTVKNLPYENMRRTGKVPKFLSHRLFPNSRYSIWIDSKMRLNSDPMLIIEYFLWRRKAEYAISNHYDRHCVWEEVLQNKRLNKYDHTAIDEQFHFYQSDGLTKFDPSDQNNPLPSYVPEGSLIVRAHTPMSNLFSCLWFNEVDRFTSRDQLSFAYTYLKLRRMNQDRPFHLYMFKDCERRALVKLFRHRPSPSSPNTA